MGSEAKLYLPLKVIFRWKQPGSINGFESPFQPLNCGVPQFSNLVPLLFLIYIIAYCRRGLDNQKYWKLGRCRKFKLV